jgi:multiple sugar transport system permease protein
MTRTRKRRPWLLWFLAALIAAWVILPLYWMLATSLRLPVDLSNYPPRALPIPITFQNFSTAFSFYNFGHYLENSAIVSLGATAGILVLGTCAGYGLARFPMRGRVGVMVSLLMISVFPEIAVVPPLYILMRHVGWLNSYQALIVPYTAFNLPFAIWILRNYLIQIPKEMEEVARIDGAGPLRTLVRIIVPQAAPGLFTAGVFAFTACWTEFLMAVTFNSADAFRTIPVGIALFGSEFVLPYGTIFAASVVSVLPIALLVVLFRRTVVSGLTQGAVKG